MSHKNPLLVVSEYQPAGDQPQAITQLAQGVKEGLRNQVLLGVTGSGKTFTMAHVIAQLNRPALVLAPNKTLAAQLYGEMKAFFPADQDFVEENSEFKQSPLKKIPEFSKICGF